jgi:hypothetical protein
METKFKKGDIVYWQDLQGEVINVDNDSYPIEVKFNNGLEQCFTKDGSIYINTPPVLSHTPYTLNGFTQNSVIEKDTLVWVRDGNEYDWVQRFYSHFENGKHYCFANQLPSNETKEIFSWNYLETENPLLKKLTPKNK